jgi:hypothetical protein
VLIESTVILDYYLVKSSEDKFVSINPSDFSQNITQSIGNNTGSVQAVVAGQDAYATQQTSQTSVGAIDKGQAVELLNQILFLIQSANLPPDIAEEAKSYANLAKKEAEKNEPNKARIVGNLEGATDLLKKMSNTTDAVKDLISKLKDPIIKLAGWLGIAAMHFFG